MRRSLEEALLDLRRQISTWAQNASRPGIHLFAYPPEWEAQMLSRLPKFTTDCEASGWPIELVDVGQGMLAQLERRKGLVDQFSTLEARAPQRLRQDLGTIAERYLAELLSSPIKPPAIARLLINTGALATFTSYSAVCNNLDFDGTGGQISAPNIIAFPGDDDGRLISLLRLRADTNYRLPRI